LEQREQNLANVQFVAEGCALAKCESDDLPLGREHPLFYNFLQAGDFMSNLENARKIINEVDVQLAALFEKRMEAVKMVAEYKKQNNLPIFDENREKEVCKKEIEYIKNDELKPYYLEFIQCLMNISKKFQRNIM
jgi:monofunctional chorismate mutase